MFSCLDVGRILCRYSGFKINLRQYNLLKKFLLYILTFETARFFVLTLLAYTENECQQSHWLIAFLFRDFLAATCEKRRTLYHVALQALFTVFILRCLFYRITYSCRLTVFLLNGPPPGIYCGNQEASVATKHSLSVGGADINDAVGDDKIENTHLLLTPNFRESHPLRVRYCVNKKLLARCHKESQKNLNKGKLKQPLHYTNDYWHRMNNYHAYAFLMLAFIVLIHIAIAFCIIFMSTYRIGLFALDNKNAIRNEFNYATTSAEFEHFSRRNVSNMSLNIITLARLWDLVGCVESCLAVADFFVTFFFSFGELILIAWDTYNWQRNLHERLDEILFIKYWRCFLLDEQNRLCLSKKDVEKATLHIINDLHTYFHYVVDGDNMVSVCNLMSIVTISVNLIYGFWHKFTMGDPESVVMFLQIANSSYFALTLCFVVANINSRVRYKSGLSIFPFIRKKDSN